MKRLSIIYKTLTIAILFLSFNCTWGSTLYIAENHYAESTTEVEKSQDDYISDKKLGSYVENGKTYFRLFTPNAKSVELLIYKSTEDKDPTVYTLDRDENAVWEAVIEQDLTGKFYGYKVYHNNHKENVPVCVDPYAKAVATFNTYMNPRLSIVYNDTYDWEGDKWIERDWRDLVIYEMHIRDLTAHKSSGTAKPGTYSGLVEKGVRGGINHIKDLGVNTVELLPAHEYGNVEIPWQEELAGRKNTWNPYERNHWGYMTSNFFAPAAYYAEDWKEFKMDTWMGTTGNQVKEFKDMVKAFHKEGIGVMMDVVYNHLSEYETGNLKEIDLEYYFRLDSNGQCIAESGCGNDIRTEAPMMRKMIIESIIFWMTEYHIDGFRFDLGKLIDWVTIEEIIHEARKINPNVVFVCEPWGGGYDPNGFSLRDWGSWNDQIRNGIKGENPNNGHGWIFGKWYGNNSPERVKSYVHGTLTQDEHGLFLKKEHAVNYLASHDGYTFGDFIRIGLGDVKADEKIKDVDKNAVVTPKQMKYNKLGAMFLLTSQGLIMIHEGQEYGRSKVLPMDDPAEDAHKGQIDHNTYNKDNEVNYLNFDHADKNRELIEYYKGLIDIREKYTAFRHADYEDVKFHQIDGKEFFLAYELKYKGQEFVVVFNAEQEETVEFTLPEGKYEVLANEEKAGTESLVSLSGTVKLKPVSGMILKKK